jgi:octaprenyl-diphosphate synthase
MNIPMKLLPASPVPQLQDTQPTIDVARALTPVRNDLQKVEQLLRASMRSNDPYADALIGYSWSLGGKRLRPSLALLTAQATGHVNETTLRLATVVELIHTATLVHDDVLDGASMRRNMPTVHTQWDTNCSILLGDFLFTEAYYQASLCDSPIPSRWIGAAAKQTCEGEIRQRGTIDHWNLHVETYLDILRAKTAELCAVSTALGAWSTGATTEITEAAERFGRYLGLAFQIYDDWLDLWGDDKQVGKSLGTDLQTGKPTLPILHLLSDCSDKDRPKILSILHGAAAERMTQLRPWLEHANASEFTLEFAKKFVRQALVELQNLPPSQATDSLRALTYYSVNRPK